MCCFTSAFFAFKSLFFGPESPNLYKHLSENCTVLYANYVCSPCVSAYNQRLSPCHDNQCLQVMSVDYVYDVVQGILENRDRARNAAKPSPVF